MFKYLSTRHLRHLVIQAWVNKLLLILLSVFIVMVKPAHALNVYFLPALNAYSVVRLTPYTGTWVNVNASSYVEACRLVVAVSGVISERSWSTYTRLCADSNGVNIAMANYISPVCPANSTWVVGQYACTCIDPYVFDNTTRSCVPEQYTLTLNALAGDIEPSGTAVGDLNAAKELSLLVLSQRTGLPQSGVQVRITLGVQALTGGHEHDDTQRPKGTMSGGILTLPNTNCAAVAAMPGSYDCTTGADGSATFTYFAPIVSGSHTISAACTNVTCISTQSATVNVNVKVAGLVPIPASTLYALTEADGSVIGAITGWHSDNHNMTPAAVDTLWRLAARYRFESRFQQGAGAIPRILHLNDSSLPWGGAYDICARPGACGSVTAWQPPHHEHRRGTVIDVRANGAPGAVPSGIIKILFKRMLDGDKGISYAHEYPGTDNEHFHIRLSGRKE